MRFLIPLISLLLTLPSVAAADTIETHRGPTTTISTLTADTFVTDVSTGYIEVGQANAVCFDITLSWVSTTGVSMRCETLSTYAAGSIAGFKLHAFDIAAGAITSNPAVWTYLIGANDSWSWCVDDLPDIYVRCIFSDPGGPATTDALTVTYRLVSP